MTTDLPAPSDARTEAEAATVAAWVTAHPDWAVWQFAQAWGMSQAGAHKMLTRNGYRKDERWVAE